MQTVLESGELRDITEGRYRHFKGRNYDVIAIAQHSETGEWLVLPLTLLRISSGIDAL